MAKLRLSLTIPGAVSLGAYEGGALAALIVAVKELGEENVVIDSIASASAGSITGLLTARALLRGCDPVALMTSAWVERVSLHAMRTHETASLLSSQVLEDMAEALLGPKGVPENMDQSTWQEAPITLSMALASLAGLNYSLRSLAQGTPVQASTYLDFYTVALTNKDDADVYIHHASAALASGANALGFPARQLDRSDVKADYDKEGLEGFPENGKFWYTDGGTVDNEPLGRTIDVANDLKLDDDRLFLLIHPDPGSPAPGGTNPWAVTDDTPPAWLRTGAHTLSMARGQSIYDDLRRLEKTNSHLAWLDTIEPAVRSGLEDGMAAADLTPEQVEKVRQHLGTSLTEVLSKIRDDKDTINKDARRSLSTRAEVPGDYADLLRAVIEAATGLDGRDPVKVEIVSPTLGAAPGQAPSSLLAGRFLFHFGGFIDIDDRKSDFALGFRNMEYWLVHCLGNHLPGVDVGPAIEAIRHEYDKLGWDDIRKGGAGVGSLTAGEKWQLAMLGVHAARVVAHDVRTGGV